MRRDANLVTLASFWFPLFLFFLYMENKLVKNAAYYVIFLRLMFNFRFTFKIIFSSILKIDIKIKFTSEVSALTKI